MAHICGIWKRKEKLKKSPSIESKEKLLLRSNIVFQFGTCTFELLRALFCILLLSLSLSPSATYTHTYSDEMIGFVGNKFWWGRINGVWLEYQKRWAKNVANFFIEKKDNRILLDSVGRRSGGKIITAEKTFGKNWTKADLRLIHTRHNGLHFLQWAAFSAVGCIFCSGLHQHRDRKFSITLQKHNHLPQTHTENAVMWMDHYVRQAKLPEICFHNSDWSP